MNLVWSPVSDLRLWVNNILGYHLYISMGWGGGGRGYDSTLTWNLIKWLKLRCILGLYQPSDQAFHLDFGKWWPGNRSSKCVFLSKNTLHSLIHVWTLLWALLTHVYSKHAADCVGWQITPSSAYCLNVFGDQPWYSWDTLYGCVLLGPSGPMLGQHVYNHVHCWTGDTYMHTYPNSYSN